MARKTQDVTIDDATSRDAGKTFRVTEMPPRQAEKWAIRALLAAAKAGIELPDNIAAGGAMRAIGYVGMQAITGLDFAEAEPLLDEMLGCIQIVEKALVRPLTEDDVEEVRTLVLLRKHVLELHVGFSLAAALSK